MVHLRIVATAGKAARALEVLERSGPVCNIVVLEGAARRPKGDVILCDIPREEASVVIADLREIGIDKDGSISLHTIDSQISSAARRAEVEAKGSPSDAVVWEEIEETTQESATLSVAFLAFMVLAALIGAVGIYLDSAILIVGAMVVGPEFGAPPVSWSQVDVVVVAVRNRRLCTVFPRAPARAPRRARPSGSPAAWSASYSTGERILSVECSRVGL